MSDLRLTVRQETQRIAGGFGFPHLTFATGGFRAIWLEPSILIALVVAFAFGFGANAAIHVLNPLLTETGFTGMDLGMGIALQALGIVCAAPLSLTLVVHRRINDNIALACFTCALAFAALSNFDDWLLLSLARFVFGCGIGIGITMAEYVVTSRAPYLHAAKTIAAFALAMAVGAALAPAVVAAAGSGHAITFLIVIGSMLGLGVATKNGPRLETGVKATPGIAPFATFGVAPLAFVAAGLAGFMDSGFLSLLGTYAMHNGSSVSAASMLAFVAFLGVVVFQIPIAILCDAYQPQRILLACSVAALLAVTSLPLLWASPWLTGLAVFLIGGMCDGFYTAGLVRMIRKVPVTRLAAGNACAVSMYAIGEVTGPMMAGQALEHVNSHGFIIVTAVALAVFALAMLVATFLRWGASVTPMVGRSKGAMVKKSYCN